jgi:hypothetical protein
MNNLKCLVLTAGLAFGARAALADSSFGGRFKSRCRTVGAHRLGPRFWNSGP